MVELVDTLVLEASAQASEFESRLGHQTWSRSINGDAVDCKSAAFGHAWFDPRILHQIRKCDRVRFIVAVLKTAVSKGTVSSNLTVSAKFAC